MFKLSLYKRYALTSLTIVVLLIAIPQNSIAFAQDSSSRVIYTGSNLVQVYWATDSNTLVLIPENSLTFNSAASNILYDITTQSSSEHSGWGLQPELTPTE